MNNVILFRLFTINGALFDCLDYYLYAQYLKKDLKLCLIKSRNTMNEIDLYPIIEDRYKVNLIPNWKDNIVWFSSIYDLLSYQLDNIYILDYYTTNCISYTRAKQYHLIYDHDENYRQEYIKYSKMKNFIVYNEMPFGVGNIEYKLKIPTVLYKKYKIDQCEKNCYINCSGKSLTELERAMTLTNKHILVSGCGQLMRENVTSILDHPKEFFKMWNTYMYIHDGMYFEPRCRLLLESAMYNKKIIYDNIYDVRDGSYYRYREVRKGKLPNTRKLTKHDIIMKSL